MSKSLIQTAIFYRKFKYFRSKLGFLFFGLFFSYEMIANSQPPPTFSSGFLVEVGSSYNNLVSNNSVLKKRALVGSGIIFKIKSFWKEQFFILTASHLTQGDIANSLYLKSYLGELFKIKGRLLSTSQDLELFEIEKPKFNSSINFEYDKDLKKICLNYLSSFSEESQLQQIKESSKKQDYNKFLPIPMWNLNAKMNSKTNSTIDAFALHSLRLSLSVLDHANELTQLRSSEIFNIGELIIENPIQAGMSGLPLFATGTELTESSNDNQLCVVGIAHAFHRILPRSYFASYKTIANVIESYINQTHKPSQIVKTFNSLIGIKRGFFIDYFGWIYDSNHFADLSRNFYKMGTSDHWKMKNSMTYRLDQQAGLSEADFSQGETNHLMHPIAGGGTSIDGGREKKNHINKGGEEIPSSSLRAGINPGLMDQESLLGYDLGYGQYFANYFTYLFLNSIDQTSHFTPVEKIKFPSDNGKLIPLLRKRLINSKSSYQIQRRWHDQVFTLLHSNLDKNSQIFKEQLDNYLTAKKNITPCTVEENHLKSGRILIRLIDEELSAKEQKYYFFEIDPLGTLIQYFDPKLNQWIKKERQNDYFAPFLLNDKIHDHSIFVDVRGLFFMDIEMASLLSVPISSQIKLPMEYFFKSSLSQALQMKKLFSEDFPLNFWPFQKESATDPLNYYDESPLGSVYNTTAYIVVTSQATSMSWPLTCVPELFYVPGGGYDGSNK